MPIWNIIPQKSLNNEINKLSNSFIVFTHIKITIIIIIINDGIYEFFHNMATFFFVGWLVWKRSVALSSSSSSSLSHCYWPKSLSANWQRENDNAQQKNINNNINTKVISFQVGRYHAVAQVSCFIFFFWLCRRHFFALCEFFFSYSLCSMKRTTMKWSALGSTELMKLLFNNNNKKIYIKWTKEW